MFSHEKILNEGHLPQPQLSQNYISQEINTWKQPRYQQPRRRGRFCAQPPKPQEIGKFILPDYPLFLTDIIPPQHQTLTLRRNRNLRTAQTGPYTDSKREHLLARKGKLILFNSGDRALQFMLFNHKFLASPSHQLASTQSSEGRSLPFDLDAEFLSLAVRHISRNRGDLVSSKKNASRKLSTSLRMFQC